MCDEKYITLLIVLGVFETGTVVFVSDVGDKSIETADDVFGGSEVYFVSCAIQYTPWERKNLEPTLHPDNLAAKYPTAPPLFSAGLL